MVAKSKIPCIIAGDINIDFAKYNKSYTQSNLGRVRRRPSRHLSHYHHIFYIPNRTTENYTHNKTDYVVGCQKSKTHLSMVTHS